MTMVGILLPIVSAVVPLAHQGYSFGKVPPLFCSTVQFSDSVYLLLLPLAIIGGIGIFLLLHVFWLIIKVGAPTRYCTCRQYYATIIIYNLQHKRLMKSRKETSLTVPEVKILIILSCVLFGGAVLIVVYSILFFNLSAAVEALDAYLDCESTGIVPDRACDREEFADAYYPSQGIFDLVLVFGFLYPCVNMLYVVEIQKVKTKLTQCCTFK